VVVVHDLFVLTNPEWYSRTYVLTHAPILKIQLKVASMIIAVSEPVATQITELTKGQTPVVVAPNAPAAVFHNPLDVHASRSVMEKFSLTGGRYVLSVASRDPRKNLEALVTSYLALPENLRKEFPLVLVGGSNSIFADVEFPVDTTVKTLGYVDDLELAALYEGSRLVAFPSLDEGFGLPAVEALSVGARLLVSDVRVMRWVCQEHADYIDPKDHASITAGLRQLIENEDSAEDRVARKRYVNSRFTWRKSAEAISTGLSRILGPEFWP
jgi:glycosyltransferase involved in cell wall biosynthesis